MSEHVVITEFPEDLPPKKCPLCGVTVSTGVTINRINAMFMLSCKCGLESKLFSTLRDLLFWWNTRTGRVPQVIMPAQVEVKHSNRVRIPDAF